MPIKIISVGKKHADWVAVGIERYQRRLKKPFDVEWSILPHSSLQGLLARQDESRRMLTHIKTNDYVVLLDERGQNISSEKLSDLLQSQTDQSKPITLIIGGAYGVDESIAQRADFVWSLSKLVFPHQLVRLVVSEQIYRAQEIAAGRPYHHE